MDLITFHALAFLFLGQQQHMIKDKDVDVGMLRARTLLFKWSLRYQLSILCKQIEFLKCETYMSDCNL